MLYRTLSRFVVCAALCSAAAVQAQSRETIEKVKALRAGAVVFANPVAVLETKAVLMVDDDGAQCPGALSTIQEAVAQAEPGTTILVCPGTYRKTVKITGAAKSGLRLIALGLDDEVILEGDHTEAYGFYLQDTDNILIRGFTIREWGNKPSLPPDQYGNGCGIHVQNSHYNIIEHNRIHKTDMNGIYLDGSANNIVRYNFITEIDPNGCGCGIWLGGKKSAGNLIFQNRAALQPGCGAGLWWAGSGNVLLDNDFNNNGQCGISHWGTEGTVIEGNRLSHNTEAWGKIFFYADHRAIGIDFRDSDNVTVFGNMINNNTLFDIAWDKKGNINFVGNACGKANQPGLCGQ